MGQRLIDDSTFSPASLQTDGVDEARKLLSALYVPLELDPVGCGPLDVCVNSVQLPLLTAGFVRFGAAVKVRAHHIHSHHINIPLAGHAINTWGDDQQQVAAASKSAGLVMSGMPGESTWSLGCQQICLMIPAQELRRQLETMLDRTIRAPLEFDHNLDLTAKSAASGLALVTIIRREAHRPDGLLSHRLAVRNLQRLLIEGLLLMQPHNYTAALGEGVRSGSPAVVTRAIELMRTHPEAPRTAGILAQHTGIGAQALTKAFARSGEQPPSNLRQLRLHRVRGTLLDADPRAPRSPRWPAVGGSCTWALVRVAVRLPVRRFGRSWGPVTTLSADAPARGGRVRAHRGTRSRAPRQCWAEPSASWSQLGVIG